MLLKNNPYSFLTGRDPFMPTEFQAQSDHNHVSRIQFELKHEGLLGIPHGGVGMGLCLDAWRNLGEPGYPVTVNFKFGGSGICIGDQAVFEINGQDLSQNGLDLRITKDGDRRPYLRAGIVPMKSTGVSVPTWLGNYDKFRALPYYRNCFVCGHFQKRAGFSATISGSSRQLNPSNHSSMGIRFRRFRQSRVFPYFRRRVASCSVNIDIRRKYSVGGIYVDQSSRPFSKTRIFAS